MVAVPSPCESGMEGVDRYDFITFTSIVTGKVSQRKGQQNGDKTSA